MKQKFFSILTCLLALTIVASNATAKQRYKDKDFTSIFNGKNLDGWYLKIRSDDQELAKKVFAVEDGMVHVFNKEFPNPYNLGGSNDTHGLMYTNKKYSKFIFRFEYKWGKTIANNYKQYQYDAGCYYHVINDKIWPSGVEYQVRYDDINDKNYTGDFYISRRAKDFVRYTDGQGNFLAQKDGGVLTTRPEKDKYQQKAALEVSVNNLNDKWNVCEVIVMADKYAIHKLNGQIVNMGENLDFSEGVIGLQSETGEIYYRNIQILEFDEIIPIEEFLD